MTRKDGENSAASKRDFRKHKAIRQKALRDESIDRIELEVEKARCERKISTAFRASGMAKIAPGMSLFKRTGLVGDLSE